MKIIGIVGGIGAGKSTVVKIIENLRGTYVIGADEIGHGLLYQSGKAYQPVLEAFGTSILDASKNIMRPALAKIVFSDVEALKKLNAITHPLIYKTVEQEIMACSASGEYDCIIIDAALLVEIGLVKLTDYVIGVHAEEYIRVKRISERDQCSIEDAKLRIKRQKKWEELKKIINYEVDNSESYDQTKEQVRRILEQIYNT